MQFKHLYKLPLAWSNSVPQLLEKLFSSYAPSCSWTLSSFVQSGFVHCFFVFFGCYATDFKLSTSIVKTVLEGTGVEKHWGAFTGYRSAGYSSCSALSIRAWSTWLKTNMKRWSKNPLLECLKPCTSLGITITKRVYRELCFYSGCT